MLLIDLIESAELLEAAALLDATEALEEARGKYVYEEVEEKRLVLGDGGQSGNCEYCEAAAERGWIGDDEIYEGPMGDEDGPPLHPNCDCELEYRTRRVRQAI